MESQQKDFPRFDVEQYAAGARLGAGDAAADTRAARAALAAASAARGGVVYFPRAATYRLSETLVPTSDDVSIEGADPTGTRLMADAASAIPHLIEARERARFTLRSITLDGNGAQRARLVHHPLGLVRLYRCGSALIEGVTITGSRGVRETVAAVAIVECQGAIVRHCDAHDCGAPGQASDAFYVLGEDCLIEDVTATGVTDTVAVLEGCHRSTIRDVRSRRCGCTAAVTNFTNADKGGNLVESVLAEDGQGTNSGAITIGCVGHGSTGKGDLLDTTVRNVRIVKSIGPGLRVIESGEGRVRNLVIEDARTIDTGTQGLLLRGEHVRARRIHVTSPGASGIQVEAGARDVEVLEFDVETSGVVAVSVLDAEKVRLQGEVRGVGDRVTWGAYFYGRCPEARVDLATSGSVRGRVGGDPQTRVIEEKR